MYIHMLILPSLLLFSGHSTSCFPTSFYNIQNKDAHHCRILSKQSLHKNCHCVCKDFKHQISLSKTKLIVSPTDWFLSHDLKSVQARHGFPFVGVPDGGRDRG